jgi:subtilisin family serine protease
MRARNILGLAVIAFTLAVGTLAVASEDFQPYYWDQLQMREAHELTRGIPQVKVAVLSTGVNYHIPEISDAIDKIKDEEGNVVYGADVFNGTNDPMDSPEIGMGTFNASLIISPTFGIAPNVKIVPVKIYDNIGTSTDETIAKGIQYALERGVKIIVIDTGGVEANVDRTVGCDAIREAAKKNILVIGVSGNEGVTDAGDSLFPTSCNSTNLLITAATDERSQLASFSNTDFRRIHVAAPGVNVRGLSPTGVLTERTGSSASSAIAAGVASLVMSYHPEYSLQQVKEALIRGADPKESLLGKVASNGRINALKALTVSVR